MGKVLTCIVVASACLEALGEERHSKLAGTRRSAAPRAPLTPVDLQARMSNGINIHPTLHTLGEECCLFGSGMGCGLDWWWRLGQGEIMVELID